MRVRYVSLIAAVIALSPMTGFAQTEPVAPADSATASAPDVENVSPLAVTLGVIGVAVVADVVSGGALSGPLLRAVGLESSAIASTAAPAATIATPTATATVAAPTIAPIAAPTAVTAPAVAAPAITSPTLAAAAPLTRPWWRFW